MGASKSSASILRARIDIGWIRELSESAKNGAPSAYYAIREAHAMLAAELQSSIVTVLEDKIRQHGREQRDSHLLVNALRNSKCRDVRIDGFEVSMRNITGLPAEYARNLEEGTSIHLGERLVGFRSKSGEFSQPGEGVPHTDVKMIIMRGQKRPAMGTSRRTTAYKRGSGRGFVVGKKIDGYHFFRDGSRIFMEEGVEMALAAYAETFRNSKGGDLQFYERFFRRYGTRATAGRLGTGVTRDFSAGR